MSSSTPRSAADSLQGDDFAYGDSFNEATPETTSTDGSPSDRLIIKSGTLSLIVENVTAAVEDVQTLAESIGGFVVSSRISSDDSPYYPYYTTKGNSDTVTGTITIRVPSDRFDEALDHVKSVAESVETESVSGQDVTEEFTDLNAQLSNTQKQEERLLELYTRAGSIEEILKVEKELTRVRGEVERLQGRIKYLENSAKLSSITISLSEKTEDPIITDTKWTPKTAARKALRDLVTFGQESVDAIVYFLIRYSWILLIIYVGFIIYKRRRS